MYKAILYKDAVKFYNKAPDNLRLRIIEALDSIEENPHYNTRIKKLRGALAHMYRYRIGDVRIIYEIQEDIKTVRIKTIEVRGNAYK